MIFRVGDYVTTTVPSPRTNGGGGFAIVEGRVHSMQEDGTYIILLDRSIWYGHRLVESEPSDLDLIRHPELEELLTDTNKHFREYAKKSLEEKGVV